MNYYDDFYRDMKGEEAEASELNAGAEHFVRLKIQTGQHEKTQYPDLDIEKKAYEIQPSSRPDIPRNDFAQPNKEEAGHEGKYPIPDRQHARSALGFAKMHHDSSALSAVKHKIEQKYPDMLGKEASAEALRKLLAEKPMLRDAIIGGLASGIIGTILGLTKGKDTEERVTNAVSAGAGSAIVGAGSSALMRYLSTKLAGDRSKLAMEFNELYGKKESSPMEERGLDAIRLRDRLREDKSTNNGVADHETKTANAAVEAIKDVDPVMAGMIGLGAIGGGLLTRHASLPRKHLGGASKAEHDLAGQVASNSQADERGLIDKLRNRHTEMEHGIAKAFRQHPHKATAIGAATGALGGYGLGRLGGALMRLNKR